jgi:hypothetical protein
LELGRIETVFHQRDGPWDPFTGVNIPMMGPVVNKELLIVAG